MISESVSEGSVRRVRTLSWHRHPAAGCCTSGLSAALHTAVVHALIMGQGQGQQQQEEKHLLFSASIGTD
jgi:hypothetical protein